MYKYLSQFIHPHSRVGISFCDHAIRMVLIKSRSNELQTINGEEQSLKPGIIQNGQIKNNAAFESILKDMVRSLKAKGKSAVIAIPDSQLVLRKFELPRLMSDQELQNYFFFEIGKKIQLPFEQPVFDFQITGRSTNTTQVVLFAAPEKVVRHYQQLFQNAGLNLKSAEINGIGIDRWVQSTDRARVRKDRMYLNLEQNALNVTIIHDDVPQFVRNVTLSGTFDPDLSVPSDAHFREAAIEIDRMLNFYQYTLRKGQDSVSAIYLVGRQETMLHFKKVLSEVISVQCELLSLHNDEHAEKVLEPHFIPALGLAMKEVHN